MLNLIQLKEKTLGLDCGLLLVSVYQPAAVLFLHWSFSKANQYNNSGSPFNSIYIKTGYLQPLKTHGPSDLTALEWLRKLFIPKSQPTDSTEKRLLILDGHGSHITTAFMWECFQNNILLLYLPPHSSHVLQPLDLGVFSSLKRSYRKRLNKLHQWEDSTTAGRRNFLDNYRLSRLDGLSSQNIKSGWKATGLWPVAASKPLLSPLLLENTIKRTQNKSEKTPGELKRAEFTLIKLLDMQPTVWSTPRKAKDLKDQIDLFNKEGSASQASRNLFRKVTKGFDEKDLLLAKALKIVEALEAKVASIQPQKRRKVVLSPNSKFATIDDIMRTQNSVLETENSVIEESEAENISVVEDCIVVN